MVIMVIKIGENEPPTYPLYHQLSKHMDIIDILPRRYVDGVLVERNSAGKMADKEFLLVKLNTGKLTDRQLMDLRVSVIREEYKELDEDDEDGNRILDIRQKRLHQFNLDLASMISSDSKKSIEQAMELKNSKQPYDMKTISRLDRPILLNTAKDIIYNKTLLKTANEDPLTLNKIVRTREWQKTQRDKKPIKNTIR